MQHHPVTVEEIKHNVQKERRICDTLEPVIQSHRLVVNAALIQKDFDSTQAYSFEHHQRYQLFFQMTRITRDRGALAKDDRLEHFSVARSSPRVAAELARRSRHTASELTGYTRIETTS